MRAQCAVSMLRACRKTHASLPARSGSSSAR
jgi:hypothetical protein